jgi:GAF domain-containing protein
VQAGDMVYAGYCNDVSAYLLMALGFPVKRVLLEAAELESFARTAGHRATLGNVAVLRRWAELLRSQGRDGLSQDLSVAALATDKIDKGFAYLCEWQLALVFRDAELGAKIAQEIRGNPILDPGSYFQAEFFVYQALTAAMAYPNASAKQRRKLQRLLRTSAAKLEKLSRTSPANFGHQHALVMAELERSRGRHHRADLEYERAIGGAQSGGFLQYEALANERAGELCLLLGRPRAATAYLVGALHAYQRWGALAKVEDMRRQHGAAIASGVRDPEQETELSGSDFLAFMRAARSMSGEIRLPQLLSALAKILSNISNAERGLVLFPKDREFVVAARWPAAAAALEGGGADFPVAIAHFAVRTERMVRLPDPDFEFLFRTDPYLAERRPQSALCLPLIHQGKLLALLYLESGTDRDAFVAGRVQLLELLASQAAISIASARFHALQLEAEQAKINPHFLFNALSSIAELSITHGARAEEAIVKLANLYRYILTQSGDRLVGLEQELEIVRSYLALEQMRLGNKLEFSVTSEGDTQAVQLPGLLIQPLAENSVKHGVVPKVGPGRVDIRVVVRGEQCSIVVEDDGTGAKSPTSGTGFGLRSVQERLALVYGSEFSFAISSNRGYRVEIEIPAAPSSSSETHIPLRRSG